LLTWPTRDGDPTLKLEYLNEANQLAGWQAHDALVDVAATVALARRLRQDETLWQECLALSDKKTFADRLAALPTYAERPSALLVHGRFGYNQQCQVPALYLGTSELAGKRHLWLRLDRPELTQTTPDTIADTTWISRQKPGEPPFMQPPQPYKLSEERRNLTKINLDWLRHRPELVTAISDHYCHAPFANDFVPDADAALYANGFATPQTETLCRQFHQARLPRKLALLRQFTDETTHQLVVRLLGRNYGLGYRLPSYTAYKARLVYEERPLLDYRGKPRLTPGRALAEIEAERQQVLTPSQKAILNDLERYVTHLARQWGGGSSG
jgi:exodeoxyribonuclease I